MSSTQTVMVCDDHPIFRGGVVNCLSKMGGLTVIAEATDVESAIAKLQIYQPDILVCDLSIPGGSGFDILVWIAKNKRAVRTIVLSMHTELPYVQRAKDLGAVGFLAKEDAETDLLHAVNQPPGSFYTSESIGRSDAATVPDNISLEPVGDPLKNVSPAERRILALLSDSLTSREIAAKLNISPRTVEAHRFRLAEKLDAKGPNKLLEWAIRHRNTIKKQS